MASDSETPKVMKHMSRSVDVPDDDSADATDALSTPEPDESEAAIGAHSALSAPANVDEAEATGDADSEATASPTIESAGDAPVEEPAAMTDEDAEGASIEQEADSSLAEPTEAVIPEPVEPAVPESTEEDAATPQTEETKPARTSRHASHAAPKMPEAPEQSRVSADDEAYAKAAGMAEPPVYGLEVNEEERAMRQRREASQRAVRVGLAIAAIAGACWFFGARPISRLLNQSSGTRTEPVVARSATDEEETGDLEEGNSDTDAQEAEGEEQESPDTQGTDEQTAAEDDAPYELAAQLTTENLVEHAKGHLFFDGNDVSVTDREVTAAVSAAGRVQMTDLVTAKSGLDPAAVAGNAALRAAAFANDLAGHQVTGTNNTVVTPTDVVWVVRNSTGDSYLVVTFPVGSAPSSGDGLTVLAASPRYRLSDSMYLALGRTIQQEMGETPMGADGKYIWSTGVLPSS